jgi:hypothetical protein
LIDFPVSQAKQTAELLSSLRELPWTDAYHGRTVMGYDCHPSRHDGTLQTFVTHVPRAPREHTGDGTFHHWSAVAAGTGEVHLVWRACAVPACGGQAGTDLGLGGRWRHRGHRLGDTHREHPSRMQGFTQGRILDTELPSDGMDREPPREADAVDGLLDLLNHGQDVTGIAWMTRGYPGGKDKARRGFREQPRFATTLGWAMALAFEDGRNSSIVGIDDFAVMQSLALSQAACLCADRVMGFYCCLQLPGQAVTLTLGERGGPLETVLRGLCEGGNGTAPLPQLLCGLAHDRHQDFAVPAPLAAKAAQASLEVVVERGGLRLHRGRWRGAGRCNGRDAVEDFFCAL